MNDDPHAQDQKMPDIEYQPAAIVEAMGTPHAMWVLEEPSEIRAKLKALRDTHGMGLDDEEEVLLLLTGLDLFTGGDEGMGIEPYDLSLHPGTVTLIRGVTERYWRSHMENTSQGGGGLDGTPPGLMEAFQAMGFQTVSGGAFGSGGGEPRSWVPMSLDEFNQGGAETECCCGHEANAHAIGDQVMGACTSCDCHQFHTHPGPDEDHPEG